ncbi:hypothetical protein T265_00136 [Opisthorchis viverrini]|uniref:Uncharacterized protein n=1 Tax=Opisthorchis viverrini TaxID=6198 RepID=A0A075ADL0_OPIVI|nr:hypothetical protein T265_00136 [Opisthorchis viverrini]KER34290.1 hypothetical protein T265_00136 [Opisthorchis viverrini]
MNSSEWQQREQKYKIPYNRRLPVSLRFLRCISWSTTMVDRTDKPWILTAIPPIVFDSVLQSPNPIAAMLH